MRCLLGLCLFGTALVGLLVRFLFGLFLFLVMLLGLVTAEVQAAQADEVEVARRDILWVTGSGLRRKRVRVNRKTLGHLV